MRACWNELFTLGLAQCAQVMSLSTILAAIVNHLQNSIQEGMFSVCDSYTCSVLPTLQGHLYNISHEVLPNWWQNCSPGSRGRRSLLLHNYLSSGDLQLLLHWPHRDLCGIEVSIEEMGIRLEDVFSCLLHLTGNIEKDKYILKLSVLTELSSHPDVIFFSLLE